MSRENATISETLEVRYKDKSIFDVLDMNIEEAAEFFQNIPAISRQLQTLLDVGHGIYQAGAAKHAAFRRRGAEDKARVRAFQEEHGKDPVYPGRTDDRAAFRRCRQTASTVLDKLVDAGNTVVVIEHNLDVIKRADHIIDLRTGRRIQRRH